MKQQLKGSIYLLITTIIWGSAFIAQSVGVELIGPFTFQTARSLLALPFLALVIFLFDKFQPGTKSHRERWNDKKLWKAGFVCGLALFTASGLQQIGLVYTGAGKAGFITAMYIVLVPVLGLFLGKRPGIACWISVAAATVGLYLLSCVGVTQINIGDLCLLGCALFYAVQITLVDIFAPGMDGLRLNFIQLLVTAVLSAAVMVLTETVNWSLIVQCWLPLCYAGILSMGVAYSMQIIGQQYLAPTPAALIMSLESVFAVLFAWLLLHETMNSTELAGCGLVFFAVILSQLPQKKKT